MDSLPVKYLFVVILAVIFVDVFCAESTTSSRRTNAWQTPIQKPSDAVPNGQSVTTTSTTPWPAIGQIYTIRPNRNRHNTPAPSRNQQTTAANKKWIQQNNIWIRNEQASAHGEVKSTSTTSSRPPLRRGETYTVIDPKLPQQKNKQQQSLLDGLHNSQLDVGPITPKTTSKPAASYAGVVGSTTTTQKTKISSTGPVEDVEETNQETNIDKPSGNSDVTDDELREFAETLLKKDSNNAMKYVTVNWQGKTSSRLDGDEAPLPLLKIEDAAFKIPSIEKIVLLYNNYFLDAGQNEVYTGQERIEENNFLDAALATPVMQFTRSFLVQKGKIGKDPKEFRDLLRQIWFNMYSRGGGKIGSSGFEHVFVAEIKENKLSGLHNWIFFNEAEAQNRANYLGYLKKIDLGDQGAIVKHHSTFHDIDKPVNSMFIGTSPELELAVYSTCFILRADRICPLKMNGNRFIIRTYTFRYRGKNMIGSAFPEI